ncbi:MAG: ABC transporter permease [Burkholderiales bacterium]|nr:ABC transporter permease [Burkholderiales bacterium]MDE1927707.1 ABC transporter permease [Burkholderiales bacterium]MDE2158678.1 ABC transporter permease [Burkholderiales bacterium]MDE2501515.1 ABC transporter permease [Burkholderiales bacterium]
MSEPVELPRWMDVALLPAVNLALALLVAGVVAALVGFHPLQVLTLLVQGAFGSETGLSYTLYYATTFTFTGLAVAVAAHGGHFNIGGEGQAMLGGLGVGLAALAWGPVLPAWAMLPIMVAAAALFGMAWGAVPGALQAWRGSHVVITTIMFNFIASALLGWLMSGPLKAPGDMTPESVDFAPSAHLPGMHAMLGWIGIAWPRTPLNLSLLIALAAVALVWIGLWKTVPGYALRTVGHAPDAAQYAGMDPRWLTLAALAVSGALAGLVGVNEIAGVQGRLMPDFVAGAGFAGIAVSLIGRNHPLGVLLAALLFGALYQGGAELAFDINGFSRDMVFMLQGLVVLFAGAMSRIAAPALLRAWRGLRSSRDG